MGIDEVSVQRKEGLKIIGYRVLCAGEDYKVEIPKASRSLFQQFPEEKIQIGVFIPGECPEEKDGYWIGMEVDDLSIVPEGMVALEVGPQTYAVHTYEGPNNQIRETHEKVHEWIASNGYERDMEAWHLELFHRWEDKENIKVELYETIKC